MGVAVAMGTKRSGHATNASTTEKISDGIRSGFKKLTGKDVVCVSFILSKIVYGSLTMVADSG